MVAVFCITREARKLRCARLIGALHEEHQYPVAFFPGTKLRAEDARHRDARRRAFQSVTDHNLRRSLMSFVMMRRMVLCDAVVNPRPVVAESKVRLCKTKRQSRHGDHRRMLRA
jgi:hypothetical protein